MAARRVSGLALVVVLMLGAAADAQQRGTAQGRGTMTQGRGGRGQPPPGGLTPREIQQYFDTYVISEAETALKISEEQYPQFVRRVRVLQSVRREARLQRNRMIANINQLLRAQAPDETRLTAATRAIDEHERNTIHEVQKAFTGLDEILTPWQRARFRVLEDQLEQKKFDLLSRARQGSRR